MSSPIGIAISGISGVILGLAVYFGDRLGGPLWGFVMGIGAAGVTLVGAMALQRLAVVALAFGALCAALAWVIESLTHGGLFAVAPASFVAAALVAFIALPWIGGLVTGQSAPVELSRLHWHRFWRQTIFLVVAFRLIMLGWPYGGGGVVALVLCALIGVGVAFLPREPARGGPLPVMQVVLRLVVPQAYVIVFAFWVVLMSFGNQELFMYLAGFPVMWLILAVILVTSVFGRWRSVEEMKRLWPNDPVDASPWRVLLAGGIALCALSFLGFAMFVRDYAGAGMTPGNLGLILPMLIAASYGVAYLLAAKAGTEALTANRSASLVTLGLSLVSLLPIFDTYRLAAADRKEMILQADPRMGPSNLVALRLWGAYGAEAFQEVLAAAPQNPAIAEMVKGLQDLPYSEGGGLD